ncbi:uncharacterized protein VTP21DRAFT_10235 [Calcarisporiella thermophila]|uniref:uncharacterized protein n=1 Tax=Calcarisporiella thermophila TaxID=911321 RepID=UPI003742D582
MVNKISLFATSLLDKANETYRTNTQDLTLVALLLSLQAITGETKLSLNLEGHGREPWNNQLDVSRTVGWFTTMYPVTLSMLSSDPLDMVIKNVKSAIRAIPDKGLSYGAIKYLTTSTEATKAIKELGRTSLSFNYLGHFHNFEGSTSFFIPDNFYNTYDNPEDEMIDQIAINCAFNAEGSLELSILFNPSLFNANILASLGTKWSETMELIIGHCCDSETLGGITASDLTLLHDPSLVAEFEAVHLPQLGLKPRDVEDIYPATPLQTSFISALARDPQSYVIQSVYEIEGLLDESRLQSAWYKIASANTILRTTFVSTQEGVFQIVLKSPPTVFEKRLEWSEDEVDDLQARFMVADRRRGFRIEDIAYVRFTLAHIKNSNRYRLFWTMHHSIIDGWSISMLVGDLLNAYAEGKTKVRPPFKAHVESILLTNVDEAREYWQSVFAGAIVPEKLSISNGSNDSGDTGITSKIYDIEVPDVQLHRYCKNLGITLSNFLRAIWAIVLRHFTRCDDVIFGCVVMGRDESVDDITEMIGSLINTIPIRIVLNDSMTVNELLQAMQGFHIASHPYSHVPLSDIRRWTGLPWSQVMFPTLFDYQDTSSRKSGSQKLALDFTMSEMDHFEATEYPLDITFSATDTTLSAFVNTHTSQLGLEVMNRIMAKFQDVFMKILRSPSESVLTLKELGYLSSIESGMIQQFSFGETREIPFECLHNGFEKQARLNPDATAIEAGDKFISYGELDTRSNVLAHALRQRGVIPGTNVGLIISRSIEMVIGMLAILKAGGAYVPIDAAFPRERIISILEDISSPILLTTIRDMDSMPSQYRLNAILIDEHSLSTGVVEKPKEIAVADDIAYIIFTSGTTGKPKGVLIRHRGAVNNIMMHPITSHMEPGIRVGQFTAVSFDQTVSDIFGTLSQGATLVLRDENIYDSFSKVNIANFTPTGLLKLNPSNYPNIKFITAIGEACPNFLVDRWGANVKFFTDYGPTEASITCTCTQPLRPGMSPTMGRVFPNMRVYVLDKDLQQVPIGVKGQLYIGGVGVAVGYLNRPELTADRFVDDPFGEPNSKMYASGDLVRFSPSGDLEFCGRIDDQVKLKGYRIELEEVIGAMSRHPSVESAVALVKDNILFGFVTPSNVDVETVRDSLFESLPDHMVPAIIIALESFPMTSNGKINKAQLKETLQQTSESRQLPVNEKQKLVISIMSSILNVDVDQIDLNTSFFALGGDSISAIALVSAFRRNGLHLTVPQLFKATTPARLAAIAQEIFDKPAYSSDVVVGNIALAPNQHMIYVRSQQAYRV